MKLPKVYEPAKYEADIYALWEKSQAFQPNKTGKSYAVVVPPPNANGNMHLGTAMTIGLEDIAVRYHRLKGDNALLLPGADHAGFETQVVYERQLAKEGKSRFDFTREQLYRGIWDFVAQNRKNFEDQYRLIGAGVDWTRYTFTLDEKIVKQAYSTFKKMWDEGLIYRGERLVNFCTFHGTAFADIEVEHKEEKGHLWYFRYPLTDESDEIIVATTRPETMLGDTAVAVNPNDKRYKKMIGKTVKLPLTEREIPIIADDFVDENFGTGAVKITPAHDLNDYEAGQRHDLPMITVIDHNGKINANAPEEYRGLTTKDARKTVVQQIKEQGYLVKTEDYTHNVGHCYKCGTVIEPLLRDQWFVSMKPLAKKAIAALEANKITFYPEEKKTQLVNYLKNLRDWNISRQIAWGIPIPAFQNIDKPDDWIFDERVDQETIVKNGKTYLRDPDVFDTWFSSSSWPYATLGYPENNDFKEFYPLSLMETGGEILYPWVSRMIMLGLYVTGEIPFKNVYIHGYVMAEDGSKMSKSLGNVINPIEVIEKFGSDALRMGIINGRAAAVNRGYDPRKVEDARNFCNKLWNVTRYIEDKLDGQKLGTVETNSNADHWILTKLQQTTDGIAADLEEYRFAEAYDRLYHFVWDDFADWYIEASKVSENLEVLDYCLRAILVIAHPFAPFLTETIWQTITEDDSVVATAQWPKVKKADELKSASFEAAQEVIVNIRGVAKILGAKTSVLEYKENPLVQDNLEFIKRLARLTDIKKVSESAGIRLASSKVEAWLAVGENLAQKYAAKIEEDRNDTIKTIKLLEGRLNNKSYVQNAPAPLVEQTRQQLVDARAKLLELL